MLFSEQRRALFFGSLRGMKVPLKRFFLARDVKGRHG
jgi:hypothetical protein